MPTAMREVPDYRGLLVYVFEPAEEVPQFVHNEVGQGRAVMATGDFTSTAALAHILDRYIDEMLRPSSEGLMSQQSFGYRERR